MNGPYAPKDAPIEVVTGRQVEDAHVLDRPP